VTALRQLAILLIVGPVGYALYRLPRCRHKTELLSADAGGTMGLKCASCGRTRPHPWGNAKRQLAASRRELTGIERELRERAEQSRERKVVTMRGPGGGA